MALRGVYDLIKEAIGAAERVAHVKVGSLLQRLMYTYIREAAGVSGECTDAKCGADSGGSGVQRCRHKRIGKWMANTS